MSAATMIWCGVLTLALIAHMFKDALEFRKIKALEDEVGRLRAGGS